MGPYLSTVVSTFKSYRSLSTATPPPSPAYVPPLSGIRSLSLLWVVSFHTSFFLGALLPPQTASSAAASCRGSLWCRPITNGHLAVDSFFVLSGHLLTARYKHVPVRFYLRRIFRIAPAFYFTFCIYCFVASLIDGPRRCEGWGEISKNVLFNQNNFGVSKQCMAWGWTVAVEVQFYLTVPFLLGWVDSRLRLLCVVGAAIAGIVSRATLPYSVVPHLTSDVLIATNHDQTSPYFDIMYSTTASRIFACYLGCLSGLATAAARARMNRHRILALISASIVLYGVFADHYESVKGYTAEGKVHFLIWSRVAFCFGLSGLTYGLGVTSSDNIDESANLMASMLDLPSIFLTPRWWIPVLNPIVHTVSYGAFLLHPLTTNGLYLVILSGDSWFESHLIDSPGLVLGTLTLANLVVAVFVGALMYAIVEKPGMDAGRWLENRLWPLPEPVVDKVEVEGLLEMAAVGGEIGGESNRRGGDDIETETNMRI